MVPARCTHSISERPFVGARQGCVPSGPPFGVTCRSGRSTPGYPVVWSTPSSGAPRRPGRPTPRASRCPERLAIPSDPPSGAPPCRPRAFSFFILGAARNPSDSQPGLAETRPHEGRVTPDHTMAHAGHPACCAVLAFPKPAGNRARNRPLGRCAAAAGSPRPARPNRADFASGIDKIEDF